MLELFNIEKVFKAEEVETLALDNVSIQIKQGEFVAIMGPSGCGKSTLLNIIGLLDYPSKGRYVLFDKEVSKYTEKKRAELRRGNIAFVFQSFNLIDELNVFENVELPLLYMKVPKKERKKEVTNILEKMNISHRKKYYPTQLSGGQQQRVAVARAVVTKPKIILADEPTGNLDSSNGEEVMKLLSGLHEEGTTIIMVTHSVNYANYAERILYLFDGQITSENYEQLKTGILSTEALGV